MEGDERKEILMYEARFNIFRGLVGD